VNSFWFGYGILFMVLFVMCCMGMITIVLGVDVVVHNINGFKYHEK